MKNLLTILFFSASFKLYAQQKAVTVNEIIAIALSNNYDIQLAKNDSIVFSTEKKYSKGAYLPTININSSITFNNNNAKQKLPDGSIKTRNNIQSNNENASVNLSWTLFNGWRILATRATINERITLGVLSTRNQMANTITEVIKNYYNIVQQKQQLKAIEEQMILNEERLLQAEKKLSVGLGSKPEVLQAKIDLNAQKAARLSQINLIQQLKAQLYLLLAINPSDDFEVEDSIPINMNLKIDEVFALSENNNPSLQIAKQQITISKNILKERKAERYPLITFNSAYNFNQNNNRAVVNNFTPLYNRNIGFNYGINAIIPILNRYEVKSRISQAQNEINYRQLIYQYEQIKTRSAVNIAFNNYELQKKNLLLEEENIVIAKENVYIAAERFKLGITTILELREAQKSLEAAYARLISARYNTKLAETELLKLNGQILQ